MKPMLPTLIFDKPSRQADWAYEIKYDGFRGLLEIHSPDEIRLISRNGKELIHHFPEILLTVQSLISEHNGSLPIYLDGEIVLLENQYKSDFSSVQVRGRMKDQKKIVDMANKRPCTYLAFDLLKYSGESLEKLPFKVRKERLKKWCQSVGIPLEPKMGNENRIQMVPYEKDHASVQRKVFDFEGEGIIAKMIQSPWEKGKRTTTWVKMKNWKRVKCFITSLDISNGYYSIGVFNEEVIVCIGQFYFGISPEEKQALNKIIKENGERQTNDFIHVKPSICVEIYYLEWVDHQLREPHFHQFLFDLSPYECTIEEMLLDEASIPEAVEITHPDKPLWETPPIQKLDYVRYLRRVFPYFLPFLKDRLLTVIRFPHGMYGESFYQKNCPEYAPDFVLTKLEEDIRYIICNDLRTFMWLGNQLAIEFHLPFQTYNQTDVKEVVFDLDPPSRNEFYLAVKIAGEMKKLFDQLKLISFVKTSGNKGLQLYIPLPKGFTWQDTSSFTEFIAHYLTANFPEECTIERLKKKRNGKLYVDYIQHAEGKTIIAPYSMRGNKDGLVATPLFWEEVVPDLRPEIFTIENVLERLKCKGCPWETYENAREQQPFNEILLFLKNQ
ncbi:bifunctional non-homologous end joining protein LigD [Bacillus pakistanensis]|uniref:DNA ligase (ATP) n=1 Tax=Rossellomorea pakistanensis TaxID=992288 RepID=A0ABS2N8J4_9BACI|nr:DNA ligase D [Bacillus pakistanensis]MBM7584182.1 bifunctional non-homologous end joining protein LigD [Bacillus pakistanensis]